MSGTGNEKAPLGQPGHEQATMEYYPPPPPGPPPNQQHPQHSNETPIPDHSIPTYNGPTFAPPPTDVEGIYGEDEHPPKKPPRPHQTPAGEHATGEAKPGWGERLSALGVKAAAPINMLATKMGAETFLPTTMDKECEKAARILRAFCKDGIYTDANEPTPPIAEGEPKPPAKGKSKSILTIPSKVISRAVGLAIFTTGRVGFHVTGATGSGVLIARLPDGSWSPPSGIQVHTLGAGFSIGLDIYDCVVVINTREALEAFTRTRMSLGSDLAVVAGPWGAGGSLDFAAPASGRAKSKERAGRPGEPVPVAEGEKPPVTGQPHQPEVATGATTHATEAQSTPANPGAGTGKDRKPSPFRQAITKPVYSYVKSRGFYAGVQIDGTVVTERKDANATFYGAQIPVNKILKGEVPSGIWRNHSKALFDIVRGAEGWRGQGQGQAGQPAAGAALGSEHAAPTGSYVPTPAIGIHTGTGGGVSTATAGMQQLNVSQPPTMTPAMQSPHSPMTKEQEAAAEASGVNRSSTRATALPRYTEVDESQPSGPPPTYVDDGTAHPGTGDSKTGQH